MKKIYLSIILCYFIIINVIAQSPCSINLVSGTNVQSVCQNTAISTITYSVSSSSSVTGLPKGVIYEPNAAPNFPYISGTPTESGVFTYTLTHSGSGCTTSSTTGTITVNGAIANAGADVTICSGLKGNIGDAAIAGYTYKWVPSTDLNQDNFSSTSFVITNSTTNKAYYTYTLTATNASCSATDEVVIEVIGKDDASFNYITSTFCKGAPNPTPSITGLAGGAFSASPTGLVINSNDGTINLISSNAGNYTVYYSTSGGCSNNSSNAAITITSNADATFSYSGSFCQNSTGNTKPLLPSGSTAGSFTVLPPGLNFIVPNTGEINLNTTAPNTYTVTNTIAAGGGCPAVSATSTVLINSSPNINVNSTTICSGQSATLTASGATTYSWSNGSSTNPLIITPITNSTYTVTGTISGCSSYAVSSVGIGTKPTITVNDATICAGQSVTLTPNGASSYSWSDGSFANTLTAKPNTTTSYTVSSFCNSSAIATVAVNPLPTIAISSTPASAAVCSGESVTLSGSTSGPITYSWTGGIADGLAFTPTQTATYTVTGTDANNCSAIAIRVVSVLPLPNVGIKISSSSSICIGDQIILNGTGATTYVWSTGVTDGIAFEPKATSTYTLTGSNANGCVNHATKEIKVLSCDKGSPLHISVSSNDVSSNGTCDGKGYTTVAGGKSPYNITFSGNTTIGSNLKIDNLCAGFYTVKTTDANLDTASFTFVIGSPATTFIDPNPPYVDSTIIDTLVTNALPNCDINYGLINSIFINSYNFPALNTVSVLWSIVQGNKTSTQTLTYQFGFPGVYAFILDLYCTNRASVSAKGVDQLYIDGKTVGIKAVEKSNISVYPNPFDNLIKVMVDITSTIKITDIIGSLVYSGTVGAGSTSIETGSFNSGVYFITISNNDGIVTKKVIKN